MDRIYEIHAEICKIFSNPIRLEMLNLLRNKEMSVTELTGKTRLGQTNISQHLSIMRAKGIVLSRRDGKNIYYKISNPKIIMAFDIIKEVLYERLKNENKIIRRL